jgi:hypothetical protein
MLDMDLALWGIYAMPLGLLICFGPALLAWLKEEIKDCNKKQP